MIGLGTLINSGCIIGGGLIGLAGGKLLKPRLQETLLKANGVCVLFIGISGALKEIFVIDNGKLTTIGLMMMIISFAIGSVFGELLDLNGKMEIFGEWLKKKTGNAKDQSFINGFVTTSLTVCIGAMAIVGSIQDGLTGDFTTLMTKGALDFITVLVLTASLGKGCIFSAIPVFVLQGAITLLAKLIAPLMTPLALSYLSLTGSVLIFCIGVNLVFDQKLRVANMLPCIIIAVIWALIEGRIGI